MKWWAGDMPRKYVVRDKAVRLHRGPWHGEIVKVDPVRDRGRDLFMAPKVDMSLLVNENLHPQDYAPFDPAVYRPHYFVFYDEVDHIVYEYAYYQHVGTPMSVAVQAPWGHDLPA